jgi:hypothetical protein
MSEHLATYLSDHLAGARFAVELIERLQGAHAKEPLGRFAGELLVEINKDRAVLQEIADRVSGGGGTIREATAWLAEKASQLKLRIGAKDALGTFEALETLSLGVLGKSKLWKVLAVVTDERLRGVDYDELVARAEAQHADIEAWRLKFGRVALHSDA